MFGLLFSLWWLDMTVVRFHCSFVGLSGSQDGGGNCLTKTSLITHLCDRHCSGETKCRRGKDIVPPPDCGDGVVRFVLYDLTKPQVPSCSKQNDQVEDLLHDQHGPRGDKDSEGLKPPADMEPQTNHVADLLGTGAEYQVDETQSI
nr:splicing factor U2af large subunit B [Tanacetum cinerariifolium]